MSAAVEGAIENIPSIGFSLCDYGQNADFSPCEPYVKSIAKAVLKNGLPKGSLLNVNFHRASSFKGLKVCRQAVAKYAERSEERRVGKECDSTCSTRWSPDK